jgi:Uma2 family endonuclease
MGINLAYKESFTYNNYKDWELEPGERYELIEGEAYAMSAPSDMHQALVGELGRQFGNFFYARPCKVRVAPYDVRLFYQEDGEDDTVVQPDVVVLCDEKKRGPEGCRGAPDLVVEVLSPSNSITEMERKRILYRRAGVKEYWLVDPEAKTILVYTLSGHFYFEKLYETGDTVHSETLPGLSVELEALFAAAQ